MSGGPTAAINDSFLFQGIPSLTIFAFGEVAPSPGMAESVIDLFSESIRIAANARLLIIASQNFGRTSVRLEPNVEKPGRLSQQI